LELAHRGSSLDILEGDFFVFGQVDDTTKVEVQTFSRTVLLEESDDTSWAEKVAVLLGNVDDCLQILANVDFQHLVHAFHGQINSEASKVVD